MTIPPERINAANWVLQFSILSLVITLLSTPYNAAVIAYECMTVYAYTSIFESVYKLLIAISLSLLLIDKLIISSVLSFTSSFLLFFFYIFYCRRHFLETKRLRLRKDSALMNSIASYGGWNVIGAMAILLRNHGLNVVMNLFFSPIMNTAHTIATQINGFLGQFVNNVYMATRPQMVKQYAAGNVNEMWNITFKSSKYAFFLMTYIAVPVLIELPQLLNIWLHDVPHYSIMFSRLIILSLMIETLTNQVIGAFQAANKIKNYQSVSSVIMLLLIPLSYISLKMILNPLIPYFIYVFISIFYVVSLLIIGGRQINLDVNLYINKVIVKDIMVLIPSFVFTYLITIHIQESFCRILETTFISILSTTCLILFTGLEDSERAIIKKLLAEGINKVKYKNHDFLGQQGFPVSV